MKLSAALATALATLAASARASMLLVESPSCNVDLDACDIPSAAPFSSLVAAAAAANATRVVVPCNACIYVDVADGSTVALPEHGLDVVGRLIFPPSANLTLQTPALVVQGRLDVAAPAPGKRVTVEFYGTDEQHYYPHDACGGGYDPGCVHRVSVGTKPFVVAGGKLDVRAGRSASCPSWTKLRYKVSDTLLRVDAEFASCLRAGDELLVTSSTTSWEDDVRSEIVAVDELGSGTEGVVALATGIPSALPGTEGTPVSYPQCADGVTSDDDQFCCAASCGTCGGSGCSGRPGGASLCCTGSISSSGNVCQDEYDVGCIVGDAATEQMVLSNEPEFAVEVASLTRDVVFMAREDGEDHMGGHLIVYHTDYEQHISGAKFENFGQGGVLGRYPIHFHMCGSSVGSVVSKNVIVNSNQRCVFIHDTHDVTVEDNVAWNTAGHCYATETGKERNNRFLSNLGARTRRLAFSNGQSDSPNFLNTHISATFWVRSMMNEWAGNVAAGSQVQGFWLEMLDKKSDQLSETSFRDNVAHSNNEQGLTTYRPGWAPTNGGVLLNMKVYKNKFDGMKFHATENLVIKSGLFADNLYSVRYGAFNGQITFQDTVIDAYSEDYYYRLNGRGDCPFTSRGFYTSINSVIDENPTDALALQNVTFENFQGCSVRPFEFYFDHRNWNQRGMGDPIIAAGVTFKNSWSTRRPYFPCGTNFEHAYLEDSEGGLLGPPEYGPGFIVAGKPHMTTFLPEGSCHTITYSGSDEGQPDGCSFYCEDACLRSVEIVPDGNDGHNFKKLKLTNEDGKSYVMDYNGRNRKTQRIFFTVLPSGQFTGTFYDENDVEVIPDFVQVSAHTLPKCTDVVTEESFTFELTTESPSESTSPTPSPPDSYCYDGIVGASSSGVEVCCAASCGQCGGSGCHQLPGGSSNCCSGTISSSGNVCSDFTDVGCIMPAENWCEYGVVSGDICCPASCGTCGGSGCGSRGPSCCTSTVSSSGQVCSDYSDIACIIPPSSERLLSTTSNL